MQLLALISFLIIKSSAASFPGLHLHIFGSLNKLSEYLHNNYKDLSEPCSSHLLEYGKGLVSLKPWALQMFDANAKFPSGLLRGHQAMLGSFDECLNARSESFRGKYCLTKLISFDIEIVDVENIPWDFYRQDAASNTSWTRPEQRLIDIVEKRAGMPFALCVPDTCTARDLKSLFPFYVSDEDCQNEASQTKEYDWGDIATMCFLGMVALLIVLCTSYDVFKYYKRKNADSNIFNSFSLMNNGSRLIDTERDPDKLACICGIRAINTLLIILGYRYYTYVYAPLTNWFFVVQWIFDHAAFIEAVVVIDTFFVISGVLVSYNYLTHHSKNGSVNFVMFYLRRICRVIPNLAILILLHATLMRHLGTGPIWTKLREQLLVENCQKYWWANLLFIQNYVTPSLTRMCLLPTWHLSANMQLFLLSPVALIPMVKSPRISLFLVALSIFCAILSTFVMAWAYQIRTVVVTFRSFTHLADFIRHYFFSTHAHASPWLVGFLAGYIIFKTKRTYRVKKNIPGVVSVFFWILSLLVIVFCVAIGDQIDRKYYWVSHAFYSALIRPLWSIAICWIIFACVHGYGGPINSILCVPLFRVISKITFSTFLVGYTTVFAVTRQSRLEIDFNNFDAVRYMFADILMCFGVGLVWHLAFESPFARIMEIVLAKLTRRKEVHKKS